MDGWENRSMQTEFVAAIVPLREKHVGAFKSVQINREPISHARPSSEVVEARGTFAVGRRDGASSKT